MKFLLLYPYPLEPDGQSLQGHYLSKGLKELGHEVIDCDRVDNERKIWAYENFKPDAVIGVGYWGDTPELILHPQKYGMVAVPWFNADGWVANYQNVLSELPLLLTTSSWVKETYIRDDVKGDNIFPCGIGYDPEIFYPSENGKSRRKIREQLGIKEGETFLLTAGGDVTSKGAQEMIRALAKINDEFSKWKYVFKVWPSFSADNHGKEEEDLIESLGLDKNKFVYLKETFSPRTMAKLHNACDIYAAPSRLEGFGMIQLEAQACGKPVISINVGGPRDVIKHGKTGFLANVEHEVQLESEWVYPHMGFEEKKVIEFKAPKTFAYRANVDQLADCTLKLMKDVDLRKRIGKAAAKHALENFHYKVTAKKIADLVEQRILGQEIKLSSERT